MRIGIALGDVTGVGPEVALKAVAAESKKDTTQYIFIGDEAIIERLNKKLSLRLPLKNYSNGGKGKFFTTNPLEKKLPATMPSVGIRAILAYSWRSLTWSCARIPRRMPCVIIVVRRRSRRP